MSVASSASSMCSVNFRGKEMTLEQALDETIRGVQNALNELQCSLRNMANLEDQKLDDEEDFKGAVMLEDETCDLVSGLVELLEELPTIAGEIRGKCPKECKDWYTDHKTRRKDDKAREKKEKKEAAAAAKLEAVANLAAVQE